jgi:bifunctional DNase/RNase
VERRAASIRVVVALACVLASANACRRRSRPTPPPTPQPAASVAESPEDPPAASAAPLPVGSAIEPAPEVFADGGAPRGYERASVWDLVPSGDGAAVLLIDAKKTTVLPIFVGGTEALTIRMRMDGKRYARPLTHDLLSSLVEELGARPVKVQIDDLRDDTYLGSIFVRQGTRVLQLDARPSDAIAISLGSGAPLYVARSVMLESGVSREEIEKEEKTEDLDRRKRVNPISL